MRSDRILYRKYTLSVPIKCVTYIPTDLTQSHASHLNRCRSDQLHRSDTIKHLHFIILNLHLTELRVRSPTATPSNMLTNITLLYFNHWGRICVDSDYTTKTTTCTGSMMMATHRRSNRETLLGSELDEHHPHHARPIQLKGLPESRAL